MALPRAAKLAGVLPMSDFLAEYNATISGAGLFDCSDVAKLELTGPDAAMFLGNLCTNDIKNLPAGSACPAFFCDPRAKVKFQAWIYHTDEFNGVSSFW